MILICPTPNLITQLFRFLFFIFLASTSEAKTCIISCMVFLEPLLSFLFGPIYNSLTGNRLILFWLDSGLIHQISNKIALNSIWQTYTWQTAVYPALLFCVGNSSGWQLEPSSFSFLKKTKTKQCPRHYRTGCHQNWLCPSNTRQHQFLTFSGTHLAPFETYGMPL